MSLHTALRAMIVANSTAKALAEAGNDGGVAALLNTPSVTVHRRILLGDAWRWLAADGRRTKLKTASESAANGAKSMAGTALDMLSSGGLAEIHADAEWWSMVDYLVGASVLSADDRTALRERCAEMIGPAEADAEIGRPITADDVSACLSGDRPNGMVGGAL